jgi:hypothetical protein
MYTLAQFVLTQRCDDEIWAIPSNPGVAIAPLNMGYDGGERSCNDSLAVFPSDPPYSKEA